MQNKSKESQLSLFQLLDLMKSGQMKKIEINQMCFVIFIFTSDSCVSCVCMWVAAD